MEIMRQKVSLRFLLLIVSALVTLNVCADSNLLPGKFRVNSSGKQVQFTKSNLYWNGSAFKFESTQTSYPTTWNANHVSHLFWSTKASSSYASSFPYMEWQSVATTDVPFFAESKKITVEGTSGLFVLKDTEWSYLISSRSNASNLRKYGVKVGNVENCLIIAPDDFSGTLKSSYTLNELNSLGLVCLPPSGYRTASSLAVYGTGLYWTATPHSSNEQQAKSLSFTEYSVGTNGSGYRDQGSNVRLVKLAPVSITSVTLNNSSVTLRPSETFPLTVTVAPSNAANKNVTWSTSNSSVATVSTAGVITAVAAGNCVITCTAADGSGTKATCNVVVHGGPSGVEAVDLGLPSGTLWANMNVGATSPEKYGGYYAWGEITTKTEHTWKNYRFGIKDAVTKYNAQDGLTELLDADDVAYVNWGEDWLMPTRAELQELKDDCTITEKTQDNVKGLTVTGPNGNSIFLPYGGRHNGSQYEYVGVGCHLWTKSRNESDPNQAPRFLWDSNYETIDNASRYLGHNIRPVSKVKAIRVASIEVIPATLEMRYADSEQLSYEIIPLDATNQEVTWSSNNESVAMVNSEGVVKAVGEGTATITCTALDGSGVSGTMTVTVINEMIINDGESLEFSDAVLEKLTYNRTMNNNNWQPLYVPFSMSYEDWKDYYDVAQINMMHQYDNDEDGEPDEMKLEVFYVKGGTLKPNYPYVIKLKKELTPPMDVTLEFEKHKVYSTEENTAHCMSMFYEYFFTGTYQGVTEKDGYYALASGTLKKASSAATLKPQRWYMTIVDRESQLVQPVENVKIVVFGEKEEDDIETRVEMNASSGENEIYDLQGRKVKQHTRPGIYIVNNKKVLVR